MLSTASPRSSGQDPGREAAEPVEKPKPAVKPAESTRRRALLPLISRLRRHRITHVSEPERVWPRALANALGLLLSVAALVGLAVLVGHGKITGSAAIFDWLTKVLVQPAVAASLAFVLLVICARSFRGVRLEYLAWLPGTIEVPDFSAGSSLKSVTLEQLGMMFRNNLTTLRLQSPAPVPGVSPALSFVDVLASGAAKQDDWFSTLVSLLQASVPSHAYRVEGTVFERPTGTSPCGVFVQVVRLSGETMRPNVIWERDWERAMRHAAAAVTAAILPSTRQCSGPWAAWRGYAMPADLLFTYEEASEAEAARRYDEALSLYHQTLDGDPMNLDIRLRIGQLQERLALYLDALVSYESLLALRKPGGEKLSRRLYPRRVRRERARAFLIAQYRRLVLLGGDRLPEQWLQAINLGGAVRRDQERRDLRDILGELDQQRRQVDPKSPQAVRAMFSAEAGQAAEELRKSIRSPLRKRLTTLTPAAVSFSSVIGNVRQRLGEPKGVDDIKQFIGMEIRRVGRLTRWNEHYNAACAWSVPLLANVLPEGTALSKEMEASIADQAVKELALACACADSGFIAGRRDWILSEDPDLAGLRARPVFKCFEAGYFARYSPTPQRPHMAPELAVSHYTRDLLINLATLREQTWHGRAKRVAAWTDVHELSDWWHEEHRAWQMVDDVADNYRDWRCRLQLLERVRELSAAAGENPAEPRFERYEEHPLDTPAGRDVDTVAAYDLDRLNERLGDLPGLIDGRLNGSANGFAAQLELLSRLDAQGSAFPAGAAAEICTLEAAVWERMREWLQAPTAPVKPAHPTKSIRRNHSSDRDGIERMRFTEEVHTASRSWKHASRLALIRLHLDQARSRIG